MAETSPASQQLSLVLGPFVGNITDSSVRIWLNVEAKHANVEAGEANSVEADREDKKVFVTLKHLKSGPKSEAAKEDPEQVEIRRVANSKPIRGVIKCLQADLGTGIVHFENLEANSEYSYQLWEDEGYRVPLDLRGLDGSGLDESDLRFWTLPKDGYGRQLDFLLMSCHYPATKKDDGFDGFAVWHQMPEIISGEQNANVRFAILAGDQVYADDVEAKALAERDPLKRKQLYLSIYKTFWDNLEYRKVLCKLPAVLMWDDHDITDGWGSREDSFKAKDSGVFQDNWLELFGTAKEMFRIMQASRNPDPLSENFVGGFDTCFRIGRAGFVVGDLRSNRNIRFARGIRDGKEVWVGRIWDPEQLRAIRNWVDANRNEIDTLFFVSSVVFSHGAPVIEQYILRVWFRVIDAVNWAGRLRLLKKQLQWFNSAVGDLRDDINDSWGADANQEETDRVLDYLFELQNPPDYGKRLNVVILTGDIHTPGYSTIYSAAEKDYKKKEINGKEWEGRAIIPHIVATPVAYEPFSWLGEAIFRHLTKVVKLGARGIYTSQVSHHFCYRNLVVVSLRSYGEDESHLKVKYYLEGFPEPQVMLFDLNHGAHREAIGWPPTVKPKGFLDKLLFWRKDKAAGATRKSKTAEVPVTPLDLP